MSLKVTFQKVEEDKVMYDPNWTIGELAKNKCPHGWEEAFEEAEAEFEMIEGFLSGKMYYPEKSKLFAAFEMTPLYDVKVVLIGQDPYPQEKDGHEEPRAQGLSFSVAKDDSIPSSLQNIFKELSSDIPGFKHPGHGDLSGWARQGVLLLNASLTVLPGNPNSCGKIWNGFLDIILRQIMNKQEKTVFILLGKNAQALKGRLSTSSVAVVEAPHPSGLSANRGFFGSKIFSKTNEELVKMGVTPIDWSSL